ncbi:hypothetical protein ACPCUV_28540 [Streptomyces platensis]|uniref:hypothetical protein n=1 Tax=Streptomyces platensis TaxID=58346 RepID=UPI003C2B324C
MLHAGRGLRDLGSLTAAAAEAGFASPSHLSSSFHATFGVRPSRVLGAGCVIVEEVHVAGAAREPLGLRPSYARRQPPYARG